ncbi:alpha/beta hydrolase family protein [Biformimicrobium ophioploci]|uniref:alpha/beta hydrolase family protein n=1 Tax=Biformimicrobium ophioploci TaxID=3036711 RepID=UPI00255328F5|nr:prolyl oligopeptidase family serine peptidase [Microbulbifer sp. NKW57]
MKKCFDSLLAVLFLFAANFAVASAPYPLEYWALRDVVSNVSISPDGKHMALRKIATKDGDPVIEVYRTDDLNAEPYRVNSSPMEIQSFYWVNDDVIAMRLRQKVRDKIDGFNRGVYEYVLGSVDIKRQKLKKYDQLGADIESILPSRKNKIIFSYLPGGDDSKIRSAFRPRAYYELDLKTGSKKLLMRGKLSIGQIEFDAKGKPWLARGFDIQTGHYVWYVRQRGDKDWREIYRLHEDSFEEFDVVGFDTAQPHVLFMTAHNGNDKVGLWEFDARAGKFGELVYRRNDVDVTGVRRHSNFWSHADSVVAVSYVKDQPRFEYFDPVEEATYTQLDGLIPESHYLRISSRSRDGKSMVVYNLGPRDPGSYYLLHGGRLQKVGSRQPLLEAEALADVRYIEYEARDGRTIPAYLTVPNGEPPYPAIVLPHGGPFVSEVVMYDEWAQLLANNGYLVLQPQYRGSRGRGLEHYTSAFVDGGQGGYKMQDDKDDGMLYLVKQGLAEKDRLAMFGWSYGGYAALVAAAREEQIYQCVIAGAAVTDNNMQVNYYRSRLRGAGRIEQLGMWDDSISPLEQAEKVNVPLLLIHGDVDQRVPPEHAARYRKALDKYGKNYKYVELEGADHFSNTLFYDHQKTLYDSMIAYLSEDCGPEGL